MPSVACLASAGVNDRKGVDAASELRHHAIAGVFATLSPCRRVEGMDSAKKRFHQAIGSADGCTTKFDGVNGAGLRRCTPGLPDLGIGAR